MDEVREWLDLKDLWLDTQEILECTTHSQDQELHSESLFNTGKLLKCIAKTKKASKLSHDITQSVPRNRSRDKQAPCRGNHNPLH